MSREQLEDVLGRVPLLSGLSEELRAGLAAEAGQVRLVAGEWLFRAGDPADAMYVVLSGRLEVVTEVPELLVLRVLDRGSAVGELALLTGQARSASVRARRDSELLRLGRDAFARLIESPTFAAELLRVLGEQLQMSRGVGEAAAPKPVTIAFVPASVEIGGTALALELTDALAGAARAHCLTPPADGDVADFGSLLDEVEHDNDHVVLAADAPAGDAWTEFCLRQADTAFALVAGEPDGASADWIRGCEPLLVEDNAPPGRLGRWIDALGVERGYLADGDPTALAERLARRLAGRSLGLVLSGGGARGLAHIGVLQELDDAGLQIDRVGGCSMGAVVGGLYASGRSPDEIAELCRREMSSGRGPLSDYTVPLVALVRGQRAMAMGERMYGQRLIEELPREYYSVSCDLITTELVLHRRGPLFKAVGASMALPGIFPPMEMDGHFLIDGGVLNNLPIETMAAAAEGPIIASDVTARFQQPERHDRHPWIERAREVTTGAGASVPLGFREIMMRTVVLGSIDTAEAASTHADVVIEPPVEAIGLMAFDHIETAIDAGRRAATSALDANRELLASFK